MRANIVRIGNSQGIRIPKVVLEQTQLKGEVELEVRDQQILIRMARKPRYDWARKFRLMEESGDDRLLENDASDLTSWAKQD